MTKILIKNECWSHNTTEPDRDDEWSRASTSTNNNVTGIQIVKGNGYSEFETCFDVLPDGTYYLLYGVYSTGDSFGNDDGVICYVDLYKTKEKAEDSKNALQRHYDKEKDSHNRDWNTWNNCTIANENGVLYSFHVPWMGYFEHLSALVVHEVRVVK